MTDNSSIARARSLLSFTSISMRSNVPPVEAGCHGHDVESLPRRCETRKAFLDPELPRWPALSYPGSSGYHGRSS